MEALEAQTEAHAEAQHTRANPGDYDCPHCLYTTLKRGASRCPICHGSVDVEYWERVRTAEAARAAAQEKKRKEEEARRLEEWERTKPDRALREGLTYLNLLWTVPLGF